MQILACTLLGCGYLIQINNFNSAASKRIKKSIFACLTHFVLFSNATIRLVNPNETMRCFTSLYHGRIKLIKITGSVVVSLYRTAKKNKKTKRLLRGILAKRWV